MGNKHYSASKIGQTIAHLEANAGYVKPTAKGEGVARESVTRWRDGIYPAHVTREEIDKEAAEARKRLAELWSEVATAGASKALELLDTTKNARDAALVGAIGTDKAALLTGQPTERVEMRDLASFLRQSEPSRTPIVSGTEPETTFSKPN